MDKDNKILLFGGTFNPIHFGHLIIAQEAVEALSFNKVIFIPSATPPHKKDVLNVYHRLKMTKLATKGVDYFQVSNIEEKREGPSYTLDTIKHFKEEYEDSEIYWLIGDDTISELKNWYKIKELLQECHFLVALRLPHNYYNMENGGLYGCIKREIKDKKLIPKIDSIKDHFTPLVNPIIEISSTIIRKRIKEKRKYATRFYMNEDVEKYIYDNQLYSDKF